MLSTFFFGNNEPPISSVGLVELDGDFDGNHSQRTTSTSQSSSSKSILKVQRDMLLDSGINDSTFEQRVQKDFMSSALLPSSTPKRRVTFQMQKSGHAQQQIRKSLLKNIYKVKPMSIEPEKYPNGCLYDTSLLVKGSTLHCGKPDYGYLGPEHFVNPEEVWNYYYKYTEDNPDYVFDVSEYNQRIISGDLIKAPTGYTYGSWKHWPDGRVPIPHLNFFFPRDKEIVFRDLDRKFRKKYPQVLSPFSDEFLKQVEQNNCDIVYKRRKIQNNYDAGYQTKNFIKRFVSTILCVIVSGFTFPVNIMKSSKHFIGNVICNINRNTVLNCLKMATIPVILPFFIIRMSLPIFVKIIVKIFQFVQLLNDIVWRKLETSSGQFDSDSNGNYGVYHKINGVTNIYNYTNTNTGMFTGYYLKTHSLGVVPVNNQTTTTCCDTTKIKQILQEDLNSNMHMEVKNLRNELFNSIKSIQDDWHFEKNRENNLKNSEVLNDKVRSFVVKLIDNKLHEHSVNVNKQVDTAIKDDATAKENLFDQFSKKVYAELLPLLEESASKRIAANIIEEIKKSEESLRESLMSEIEKEIIAVRESYVKDIIKSEVTLQLSQTDFNAKVKNAIKSETVDDITLSVVVYLEHVARKLTLLQQLTCPFLGFKLWDLNPSPRKVIQPNVHPGECWPFVGAIGQIVLKLSHPIYVTGVTLEHIPKSLSPNGKIESAPKDFSVTALTDPTHSEGFDFGNFSYEESGTPLQFFSITNSTQAYRFIEVKFHSNWGHPDYTCVYRIRVHGNE
ncbi:SUN domain-containing protein 2 [Nymphon striatum]|nr:SUN domain-containing protein 2 [Nymphon striatum]